MISESEIRAKLADFVLGLRSLEELEEWLVQASWNMHLDSSDRARSLASSMELVLAEFSSGHLLRAELDHRLCSLLDRVEASFDLRSNLNLRQRVLESRSESRVQVVPLALSA